MRITNFKCVNANGETLKCDAFGNNAAINCPRCNHSILFVALKNQKGSSDSHHTQCLGCNKTLYIDANKETKIIIVREPQ